MPFSVPCPDGLLCALALDPCSVPRNRWFQLYTAPPARAAHRRAGSLRRLRGTLLAILRTGSVQLVCVASEAGLALRYHDQSLSLQRTVSLTELEASVLRCLMADDAVPPELTPGTVDRDRVRAALRTLDDRYCNDPGRLLP